MRKTYSFGETPKDVIIKALMTDEELKDGVYPMTIRSQSEWAIIAKAVNQGIDSHLEAISERSQFDPTTGKCLIHPEEMPVFLRRLYEDESEEAWRLRSEILDTLGIEEF